VGKGGDVHSVYYKITRKYTGILALGFQALSCDFKHFQEVSFLCVNLEQVCSRRGHESPPTKWIALRSGRKVGQKYASLAKLFNPP
jgi:hypothetical protein